MGICLDLLLLLDLIPVSLSVAVQLFYNSSQAVLFHVAQSWPTCGDRHFKATVPVVILSTCLPHF